MIKLDRLVTYLLLIIVAIMVLFPLYWELNTSLMLRVELHNMPPHWVPYDPGITFKNYRALLFGEKQFWGGQALGVSEFVYGMRNSFLSSISTAFLTVLVGSPAAYAIARMRFPGRDKIVLLFISTRMIPVWATLMPLFIILSSIGLIDTIPGLVIVFTASYLPFVIYLLTGIFSSIPRDLEDAARVDGCSRLGALFRVIIPVAAPGIISAMIYSFLSSWNSFYIPMIYTHSLNSKTFTVTLGELINEFDVEYGVMAAGAVVGCLPPLFIALFMQRFLVKGITTGALK